MFYTHSMLVWPVVLAGTLQLPLLQTLSAWLFFSMDASHLTPTASLFTHLLSLLQYFEVDP
jgi:hypothetical protein